MSLSKFGDVLAGCSGAKLEEELEVVHLEAVNLEAVDGRWDGCWDSIHQIVNSKLWECGKVTLPLKLFWRTAWWWSICIGRHWRSWGYSEGSTWYCANKRTTVICWCIVYSVYAALDACCNSVYTATRCILQLGVCCNLVYAATGCMLQLGVYCNWVYAATRYMLQLGICCNSVDAATWCVIMLMA